MCLMLHYPQEKKNKKKLIKNPLVGYGSLIQLPVSTQQWYKHDSANLPHKRGIITTT